MDELLTAAQMRAVETAAIEAGDVSGLELMERAGGGVVDAILREWPTLAKTVHRAVILCGPGNNGGDGFVIARLLGDRGWDVDLFLYGDPERLPPDARANHDRWRERGEVGGWDDGAIAALLETGTQALVVDALFGTGLTRALPHDTGQVRHALLSRIGKAPCGAGLRIVAVDIPSGLCSDSGRDLGGAWPADLSVTFHRAKVGHYLVSHGPRLARTQMCGKVVVTDIGLGDARSDGAVGLARTVRPGALRKAETAHKFDHGHALVVSGGPGRGGAARLAARSALRVGAGLVTLSCPSDALPENAARLDAIMLRPADDAGELAALLEDDRINALCLGPGLGLDSGASARLAAALRAAPARGAPEATIGRAVVLDADALTLIARDPGLFRSLHGSCVLTPHAGEFGRLFPDIAERLAAPADEGPAFSKVDAAREAARRCGGAVLFKGADTVVASPDGRATIQAALYGRAAPWLATAGAGDVLAGLVTGLLARGLDPHEAATTAAWVHVEAARRFGAGLIAEDLPEMVPQVLSDLPDASV